MADGSLKFDTKIDTDGFEGGVDNLKDIMKHLQSSIDNLSNSIKDAFAGINTSQIESAAGSAAQAMDIADGSARRMEESMRNVDAAIAAMEQDAVSDIIPDSDTVAAEALESALDDITASVHEAERSASEFKNTLDFIIQTGRSLPAIFGQIGNSIKGTFAGAGIAIKSALNPADDSGNQKIKSMVDELDRYKDRIQSLESQGYYFGDKEYDETYSKLQRLSQGLNDYKKSLTKADGEQKKAAGSTKKVAKSADKAKKSVGGLGKAMKLLKMSLLFSVAFRVLNAATTAVKEGFQNLAQYSASTNKNLSALATTGLTLKNSFATAFDPILTTITPALQTLINYLSQAITTAGQFFAVFLNGATTFTKAKDAQVDYAKSLQKTAKEAKKALSPIDKLNVVGDDAAGASGTPGIPEPSQMFEEVEIDSKLIDTVNSFKDTLSGLFEPIKSSWDIYGQPAIDSVSGAFGSVLGLIGSIRDSFSTVWLNGTGTETIDNILIIFTNINDTISAITENFNTAWVTDGTGTQILQDIWNIINNILGGIRDMSQATLDWATTLDFTSILTAFQELTGALEPLTGNIVDALVWLYENVLLPLAKWTIEDVIPLFFEGLAAVFDILNETIEALKPLALWLWENLLKPIAEWTGGVIVDVLGWIVDKLKDFGDWIGEHQGAVETFAIIVGSFAAAWGLVNAAMLIWNVVGAIATGVTGAFSAAVAILTSPITLVVLAIGTLIAIVVLLVKNWDKVKEAASKCWEGIKTAWNKVGDWFDTKIVQPIAKFFTGLWDGLKKGAATALENIKTGFKTVFNALINLVKSPVNAIIDIINGMINGVVSGINSVIRAINSISFTLPDWIPGIGGKSIGFNVPEFAAPKIPRLATGTVVPANYGEFLSIMGDSRYPEIVSPIPDMKQAFKEALMEMGGAGTGKMVHGVFKVDKRVLLDAIVEAENENYESTGDVIFAH
ncbi:gas vesicle protein [Anaerotaenia torta]|uniref:phage tail protein n=1 Tax=Anaerotaenia torta TaxID=433293 RepID=UPI003D20D4FF